MKVGEIIKTLYYSIKIFIALWSFRKIGQKLLRIFVKSDFYIAFNKYGAMFCSGFLVLSYCVTAMLCWVIVFKHSEFGFYLCNGGMIPVILVSIYLYKNSLVKRTTNS